jgi:radical SAM superfamily enzyme YgiQ (UPF0313 family)/intein/homing endonuclease
MRRTDVLFIEADSSKTAYQSLADDFAAIETPTWSLLLAQSCRSRGFIPHIIDQRAQRLSDASVVELIREYNPRLVLFVSYGQNPNSSTTNMIGATRVAELLRNTYPLFPIAFMGTHVTALPKETMIKHPFIDICILGDGVYALHDLLSSDLRDDYYGKVDGITYWFEGTFPVFSSPGRIVPHDRMDIDLPGYAWDLIPPLSHYRSHAWHPRFEQENRSPFASVYTSLGCNFGCSFCIINSVNRTSINDKYFASQSSIMRYWSPDHVLDILGDLVERGVETLRISDEMFFLNKKYYEPLLQGIIDRDYKLRMWAYTRIDTVRPQFLELFRKAGVESLCPGIECLATDTVIPTYVGISNISDINKGDKVLSYDTITGNFGYKTVTRKGYRSCTNAMKVILPTEDVVCSREHKFYRLNDNGVVEETPAEDLMAGDFLIGSPHNGFEPENNSTVSMGMARITGFALGDGNIRIYGKHNTVRITIHKIQKNLIDKYVNLCRELGSNPIVKKDRGRNTVTLYVNKRGDPIIEFIRMVGLGETKSGTKFIPPEIVRSSNKILGAFIAGLFDADGCVYYARGWNFNLYIGLKNHKIIRDLKYLLLYRFGIRTSRIQTKRKNGYEDNYVISIKNQYSLRKFIDIIPIWHPQKAASLRKFLKSRSKIGDGRRVRVPPAVVKEVCTILKGRMKTIDGRYGFIKQAQSIVCRNKRWTVSEGKMESFVNKVCHLPEWGRMPLLGRLWAMVEGGVEFVKVERVEQINDTVELCDITVDKTHTFVAGGLVTHNSGHRNVRLEASKGKFKDVDIVDVVRQCESHDIEILANFIVGLPEDTMETMKETQDLAEELNTMHMNVYPAQALPGSELYYQAQDKGWKLPNSYEGYAFLSYESQPLPTNHVTAKEVLKFRDNMWRSYFTRPEYLDMIEKKFGAAQRKAIEEMSRHKLRRKILGD